MTHADVGFDIFLSYAREDDAAFRDALIASLSKQGLKVWFDRESLGSRGGTFHQEIRRAIEQSARLLAVFGADALVSDYVTQEWGFAEDLGVPVIPVLQAGSFEGLPQSLRDYPSVDARPPRDTTAVVAEILRLLAEPVQPLARCFGLPTQPAREIARPQILEELWQALGLDRQRPMDAGRARRCAALYGMTGAGKSTVAAAFARSARSRRAFPDGILWLKCGPDFQPLAAAREALSTLAAGSALPETARELRDTLSAGLANKQVLLVLDDVHDGDAADDFVAALGPGGRALLTTLDQAVATSSDAVQIAVQNLDDPSSRHLLETWTGSPLPDEAEAVLAACDGLPFALAIIGAMIQNRVPWARVLQALDARRLDLLEARFRDYPHRSLLRALGASYDALRAEDPRAAECYLELAAFRPGAALTEAVLVRLWSRPNRLPELDASLVAPILERRLLLHVQPAPTGKRYTLHRLHDDFVRLECANAREVESALIETYRTEKGAGGWATLRDDGYVYDHLIAHLTGLGRTSEVLSAVDSDWVARQFQRRGDLGQALDDVRLTLGLAIEPPLDLPVATRLSLLHGQISSALRGAPRPLLGALAAIGDTAQALRWAADQPDPKQRFDGLVEVAQVLAERGQSDVARRVVATAAQTIPLLGGVVETGTFSGLTALNAVHALVHFPYPDQWEGTTTEYVSLARVPLDALIRLAPVAGKVGAVKELATVSHPFWELYGHLIPLVAVERLGQDGESVLAGSLLARIPEYEGEADSDTLHAAIYRRAVAAAAIGRFEEARQGVESLPASYHAVGYRGIARHLAAAGRLEEALDLTARIDDSMVLDESTTELIDLTIDRADPANCGRLAEFVAARDWAVAAAWLLAAAGEPTFGLGLLRQAPKDDLRLGLGVRLGSILFDRKDTEHAHEVARELVPAAERLMGAQWFAPETTGASPEHAKLADGLLALLAKAGEPLPETITPLALVVEAQWSVFPDFKLTVITQLALAGRFSTATQLAEQSALSFGRALGLATAIAAAAQSTTKEEIQSAAADLAQALQGAEVIPILDLALGAVMRVLASRGHRVEADRIAGELLRGTELRPALAAWALDRAREGDAGPTRRLMRRLVQQALPVPGATGRALVLTALASRRNDAEDELAAAGELLADVHVSAAGLDVVFEQVGIQFRRHGMEAASSFARSVPGGEAARIVEELLKPPSYQWRGGPPDQEIAAAAAVRAAAAASVAVGAGEGGASKDWLARADALAGLGEKMSPAVGVAGALARYLAAARAAVDGTVSDDPGLVMAAAWLLYDRGEVRQAVRLATRALEGLRDSMHGSPRLITAEDLERRWGIFAAARAGLRALVALDLAEAGKLDEARAEALAAAEEPKSFGWLSLGLSERCEIEALLAVALQRAGESEAAARQLDQAMEPSAILAGRGEVGCFERLCHAATRILPPDRAATVWADWLLAASRSGADPAIRLIAAFLRWAPEQAIANVTADATTGRLFARASAASATPITSNAALPDG